MHNFGGRKGDSLTVVVEWWGNLNNVRPDDLQSTETFENSQQLSS